MILKLFLFWRANLLLLTYIGSLIFPKVANGGIGAIGPNKEFDFWASWAQWDGGHFVNIANFGYFAQQEYAFFPLFPFLIKTASFLLFGNTILAGLLIANISFFLFLIFFYKLAYKKFGKKTAVLSLVTLLTFPTAFFAGGVYSESIFLLLAVLTLYWLENKKVLVAASFAALASFTRFIAIFLIIPVAYSYFQMFKLNNSLRVLLIPFSVSGFLIYSSYLYFKFQDPLYFLTVETSWHRKFTNPMITVFSYLTDNPHKPFNDYLDVSVTIGFLLLLAFGAKKIPRSWWLFSLLAIIIPAASGTLTSMPRYALAAFPVFMIMGDYLKRSPILRNLIWIIFLFLQIVLSIMFVNGHWTA